MHINILITGNVRNIYDFYLALSYLKTISFEMRIKRVVFSTWEDIDQEIYEYLLNNGVEVITQKLARHAGPSNVYHQYRSFIYGLSFFDKDEYVLKMRTDLNGGLAEIIKTFKSDFSNDADIKQNNFSNKYFKVFSSYVYANRASILYPGRIQDVVFLGKQKDLVLLAHYSNYFFNIDKEILDGEYGPEFTWFGHPFLTRFPSIQYLYNLVDLKQFSNKIRMMINSDKSFNDKDFIFNWIAFNLMIIANNIRLPDRVVMDNTSLEQCLKNYKIDLGFWEASHKHYDFRIINLNIFRILELAEDKFDITILDNMRILLNINSQNIFLEHEKEIVDGLEKFCLSLNNRGSVSKWKRTKCSFKNFVGLELDNFPILKTTFERNDEIYLKFFFRFCAKEGIVSLEKAVVSFFCKNMQYFIKNRNLLSYLNIFEKYELISQKTLDLIYQGISEDEKLSLKKTNFETVDRVLRVRG